MSVSAALIRYDPRFDRRAAGMTLLERAVLVLGRVGVRRVAVLVAAEDRPGLEQRLWRGRLAGLPLVLLEATPDPEGQGAGADAARAVEAWRGESPLLVLDAPMAMDATFAEAALIRLLARPAESGVLGLVGGGLRLVPAGCGWSEDPVDTIQGPAAPGSRASAQSGGGDAGGESASEVGASDAHVSEALPGTLVEVTDAASARRARRALLAQSIKPLDIDGVVCWLLVRRISVRISALLLSLPVTPNQVTLLSILLGLAAAVAVGVGRSDKYYEFSFVLSSRGPMGVGESLRFVALVSILVSLAALYVVVYKDRELVIVS